MELRSSRRQNENEYTELKITLNGMGFYEEGMELQEMRQIIDALQESVSERETIFLDDDIERAIRESEMDFMPLNNERVFNSTMFMGTSPCNSPDIPSQRIVINADVHHPLDWSPSYTDEERWRRKRLPNSPNNGNNNNLLHRPYNCNEIIEPDSKCSQQCMDGITTQQSFSNIDPNTNLINECQDVSSPSSYHAIDENINSNHKVIGAISMRPVPNDSGVNLCSENTETSPSTSTSTSSSISSTSTSLASNNKSNMISSQWSNTSERSSNSVIEIQGPVSLRRPINDSGVNSFNDTANISSSSWEFPLSTRSSVDNRNSSVNCIEDPPTDDADPHESDQANAREIIVDHVNRSANGSRFKYSTVYEASPYKTVYANGCNGDDDDDDYYENSEPSI